jgi:hypothetical protein
MRSSSRSWRTAFAIVISSLGRLAIIMVVVVIVVVTMGFASFLFQG